MGKCYYNHEWSNDPRFKDWVKADPDENKFVCRLCDKSYLVGSSGIKALTTHMNTQKHLKVASSVGKSQSIINFTSNSNQNRSRSISSSSSVSCEDRSNSRSVPATITSSVMHQPSIQTQAVNNDTLKAELLWTMHVVSSHGSARSSDNIGCLFRAMFADSDIAKQFKCSRTKLGYLSTFGIAPVIKDSIISAVKDSEVFVIMFDESMNPDLQKKQMDVHLRFLDVDGTVKSRYVDSFFLGHAKATDIVSKLQVILDQIGRGKLVQLSMDGPNVNWKVFKDLSAELQENEGKSLLNIGSCGLHTLHNSFKDGACESGWDLANLLKSLYYLFQDSPARREDFKLVTDCSLLPLKFCGHRWLENVPAAERAIQIWPSIKKYITAVKKGEVHEPTCTSFKSLAKHDQDRLLIAKLHSFIYVAKIFRPFLTRFQKDEPLAPFLAKELFLVVKRLCSLVLNENYLEGWKKPSDVTNPKDIEVKHYKSRSKIEIGHQAETILCEEKKHVSELQIMSFKMDFMKFVKQCVTKIINKSPLRFPFANDISCLDPNLMKSDSGEATSLFKKVVKHLNKHGWLDGDAVDEAIFQFNSFKQKLSLIPFSGAQRLDEYFNENVDFSEMSHLKKVLNIILVLSHGNSEVERGFSVNKEVTVENLMEESLVSRRIICQYVAGKNVGELTIPKEMLVSGSRAWRRYLEALEEKKKFEQESETNRKRKRIQEEVKELVIKKRKMELDIDLLIRTADELSEKAEGENAKVAHELIMKSNAMRRDAKEKKSKISTLLTQINEKEGEVKVL